jgi:hypothetical protein
VVITFPADFMKICSYDCIMINEYSSIEKAFNSSMNSEAQEMSTINSTGNGSFELTKQENSQ